ncbi:uncharacterized protein LOC129968223 [Argiope bruennichi]|uniref:uncharacterized protein LOC129968223 n=1 Tax=Argiope bruennichi TaxID=94029 RepID=UPI002493D58A|nr:uncharacterized protein LOC129968223 [Argiope bruennichi]
MAKSDSRSSLNLLSDDSDIFENAKENDILAAESPLRNPPTTSVVVEKFKNNNKKHSLSSRFLMAKANKTANTAETTKQQKRKKRLAKSLKKAKQKLTEKHLNLIPEGVSFKPLPKVSNTDIDNMESEDLIPGTPESQQGIFNNFERSHFSAVNDLQTFIAKHKLKSNAAVELMGIFTRLVESLDMGAINKRIETLEQKVGIPASPPAQPKTTKTYASVAQQWSQGLLPTPNLQIQNRDHNPPMPNTAKPPAKPLAKQSAKTPAKQPVRQRAPEQAKRQKITEKAEFVALPTILVAPLNSDPMEEENTSNLNLKSLLEANIRPKALGVRIISCREARSKNILISVPTQEMASKLLEAINVHTYLKTICEARFPQKHDPQIIIYDVDNTDQNKNVEEENFINRIKADNNLPDGKIRVLFRKPGRGARSHWVLSLSPNIFKVIQNDKRLHYGFGSKKFKEHLEPIRCQNCLRFGHTKNTCTAPIACSKCCENHTTKTCNKNNKTCRFCRESNRKQKTTFKTDHSATSLNCPFYKKNIEKLKAHTNYD